MHFSFDEKDAANPPLLRAIASFALMLAGDLPSLNLKGDAPEFTPCDLTKVPAGTADSFPTAPPVPSAAQATTTNAPNAGSVASVIPVPPPNVLVHVPVTSAFDVPTSESLAVTVGIPSTVPAPPVMPPLPATSAPPMPSVPPPPGFSTQPPSRLSAVLTATAGIPGPGQVLVPVAPPAPAVLVAATNPAGAVSADVDSAGLPWDARIHSEKKTTKTDGTWRLRRNLDPAFVQQVVQELVAKKPGVLSVSAPTSGVLQPGMIIVGPGIPPGATVTFPEPPIDPTAEARAAFGAPPLLPPVSTASGPIPGTGVPPAPQVPLPPNFGAPANVGYPSVPVPPAAPGVFQQPAVPQVNAPVMPPASQPGTIGGSSPTVPPFKLLLDKVAAATKAKQIDPRKISPLVQRHGAPNLNALNSAEYGHLIPAIDSDVDLLIAGLPVEGVS